MHRFITRHADKITGVLRGFDPLVFRGHLLPLCTQSYQGKAPCSSTAGATMHSTDVLADAPRYRSSAAECVSESLRARHRVGLRASARARDGEPRIPATTDPHFSAWNGLAPRHT